MIKTVRGVGRALRHPTDVRFARYMNMVSGFVLAYVFTMLLGTLVAVWKLPQEELSTFFWMMATGSLFTGSFGAACAYDAFKHRRWFALELTPTAIRDRRDSREREKKLLASRQTLDAEQAALKKLSDAERLREDFVRAAEALAEHEGQNTLAATVSASDALDVLLGKAKAKAVRR